MRCKPSLALLAIVCLLLAVAVRAQPVVDDVEAMAVSKNSELLSTPIWFSGVFTGRA